MSLLTIAGSGPVGVLVVSAPVVVVVVEPPAPPLVSAGGVGVAVSFPPGWEAAGGVPAGAVPPFSFV